MKPNDSSAPEGRVGVGRDQTVCGPSLQMGLPIPVLFKTISGSPCSPQDQPKLLSRPPGPPLPPHQLPQPQAHALILAPHLHR